ncbi:MAG: ABC transporter permease [Cellulosilyticaceae bacterium]
MNFFNLAINNVHKKFFSYVTYFFSTIFAVTVFYVFCSIYYNPQFANLESGMSKTGIILRASSVIVFLFSSIFIFYSNSLFIKTRKKEIAIFSLLGMKKSDIGRLLFYETSLVGMLSVVLGIVLGTLFSRFFSMILLALMKARAQGSNITFSISWQPMVISIILFAILFLINATVAYRMIYRHKLIELLSAEKEIEKAPKFSPVAAVLSLILIGISYAILLSLNGNAGGMRLMGPVLIACTFLIIGTYLLFKNLITWLMVKLKSNQSFYYRTRNFISISQIACRMKTNSNILCLISLLCAITISIMSAAFAVYAALGDSIPVYAPFSYLCTDIDNSTYSRVIDVAKSDDQIKLKSVTQFDVVSKKASLEDYMVVFGSMKTKMGQQFQLNVIRFSDYKNIVKNTEAKAGNGNKNTIVNPEIESSECIFLDGNYSDDYSKNQVGNIISVQCGNNSVNFKITDTSLFKYVGVSNACATIVVTDSDYSKYFVAANNMEKKTYVGLKFDNQLKSENIINRLNEIVPKENKDGSYIENYKLLFSLYGTYIFIGAFLGILFLLAAGSIIFYKQLMEARDEAPRYNILKKIGLNRTEAKQIVKKQMAFVFMLPLTIGVLHCTVSLATYRKLMYTVATDSPILGNALIVVLIYLLIYGFFYVLSVNGYMRTVWDKKA